MSCEVRPIVDEVEQYVSIAAESLLSSERSAWQLYLDRIGIDNMRGVFENGQLVGGMGFYRMAHWFGGRELAAAGFSGVAINPAHRGGGTCATMLTSLLNELRGESMPLASLYASTQRLYRGVGFEQAGGQWQYSIPIRSLGCFDRELPATRYESPPMDQLNQVANARARLGNGHLTRTEGLWQRLLRPYDTLATITYVLGEPDSPQGFAIFKPGTRQGGVPQSLVSTDIAANTPRALRRLATLIHDHRALNDRFSWFGGPDDTLMMVSGEQSVTVDHHIRWMLRIVDLPSALSGRGYSAHASGELHLEIEDDLLKENSGRWTLAIDGGSARVQSGGEGSLKMNISALAPLFSSFFSASQLVRLGMITSEAKEQISLADRAFSGPSPWVSELF